MAIPVIVYFGASPSTIVMQSNTQFNGTAQTGTPVLSPAVYTFAPQSGGGLYNFHDLVGTQEAIQIISITYMGGGTLTVNRIHQLVPGTPQSIIGTVSSAGDLSFTQGELTLPPGQDLLFTTTAATNPVIAVTAKLADRTRRA